MPLKSLSPLYGKKVLLLTHSGADVDSFGSAAAIQFSLKGKANAVIGVPDHLNLPSKAFAERIRADYEINPPFRNFGAIVCLDYNKASMLGSLKSAFDSFEGEKFLIDHHVPEKERLAPEKNSLQSKDAISTTELVYSLLKKSRMKIPKKALECIAAGIVTDSAGFLVADHKTFSIMAEVMRAAGISYGSLVSLFSVEKDLSQKIAALKAARRCRIYKSRESIFVSSDVGAFEADSATALIRVGADVAFCGYAEKGKIRVSGRVNNSWLREKKFDLARDVFNRLKEFFEGEGGGHPGAAGFNGSGGNIAPVLEKCIALAHEFNSRNEKNAELKEYP
ncbi:MAG: DHH family phosphoesterase [archaeon]